MFYPASNNKLAFYKCNLSFSLSLSLVLCVPVLSSIIVLQYTIFVLLCSIIVLSCPSIVCPTFVLLCSIIVLVSPSIFRIILICSSIVLVWPSIDLLAHRIVLAFHLLSPTKIETFAKKQVLGNFI